jgi:hypothetical protein
MRLGVHLAVCAVAVAFATAADAAGPYDGTYAGTSLALKGTSTGGKGNACTTNATAPAALTITNGHAQTKWGHRDASG